MKTSCVVPAYSKILLCYSNLVKKNCMDSNNLFLFACRCSYHLGMHESRSTDVIILFRSVYLVVTKLIYSVLSLWHRWLGVRKSIRLVKKWVMRCWRGYLSAARCKWFMYGPADATATPSSLASLKSRSTKFGYRGKSVCDEADERLFLWSPIYPKAQATFCVHSYHHGAIHIPSIGNERMTELPDRTAELKHTRNVGQCPTWWPPCRI